MRLTEFLADRVRYLTVHVFLSTAGALFLWASGTQIGLIILLLIAWFICQILRQGYEFYYQRNRLQELSAIMENLTPKYLFTECIPPPRSLYEKRLTALFRQAGRAMIGAVSDAEAAGRDYRAYIESWVHEIKTPITAAELISRNAEAEMARKLHSELAQINNHVERALFYARAESPEKDFLIREIPLADMVTQAIAQHQSLLIQNGVQILARNLDYIVYTDKKWVVFMLGQLLQNAVRYRGEAPLITLSAHPLGSSIQLTVEDNGIGIAAHELPRVFERGFTGSNGRLRGGSTGMGLYLCQQLAKRLAIELHITSTPAQGTCISLTFPAKNVTKM